MKDIPAKSVWAIDPIALAIYYMASAIERELSSKKSGEW